MGERTVEILQTADALFEAAAQRFIQAAQNAIQARGRFAVALSGGSTPRGLHAVLARHPDAIDWQRVLFFFGDERSVGPTHPQSNYRLALETLFEPLQILPSQVLRMEGERTPLTQSADDYETALRQHLGDDPRLDLVLLGMGEDGHTASLFPGTAALEEASRWVVANEVPQLDTWRLTLTYPLLNRAREVLFMVTGGSKASVLAEIHGKGPSSARYPSAALHLDLGVECWLIDSTAGALLSRRES